MARWRRRDGAPITDDAAAWSTEVASADPAPLSWEKGPDEPDDQAAPIVGGGGGATKLIVGVIAVIAVIGAITVVAGGGDGPATSEQSADDGADLPTTTLGTLPSSSDEPTDDETPAEPDDRGFDPLDESASDDTSGDGSAEVLSDSPIVRPSVTSTDIADLPDGFPTFDSPHELVMVLDGIGGERHATLSLPSGRLRIVPLGDTSSGTPVGGAIVGPEATLVTRWDGNALLVPRDGAVIEIDVGRRTTQSFGSYNATGVQRRDGEVVFLVEDWSREQPNLYAVDQRGDVIELGERTTPIATPLLDGGSLVSDAGGTYLVGEEDATRLSSGVLFTVSEPWIVVRECSETYQCGLASLSLTDGSRIEFAPEAVAAIGAERRGPLAVSPDGASLASVAPSNGGEATLTIVTADGGVTTLPLVGPGWEARLAWHPDGAGVFYGGRGTTPGFVTPNGDVVDLSSIVEGSIVTLGLRAVETELPPEGTWDDFAAELSGPVSADIVGIDGDVAVHLDLGPQPTDVEESTRPSNVTAWSIPGSLGTADVIASGDGVIIIAANGNLAFRTAFGAVSQVDDSVDIPNPRFPTGDARLMWRPAEEGDRFELVPTTFLDIGGRSAWKTVEVSRDEVFGGDGAGGLVYRAGGDVFVATGGGVDLLTSGELVGIGPTTAYVHECDELGRCNNQRIDRVSGDRIDLSGPLGLAEPIEPGGPRHADGSVSPDGDVLVATQPVKTDGSTLAFIDGQGAKVVPAPVPDRFQPIGWTPDSAFAVYLSDGVIQVYDRAAQSIVTLDAVGEFDAITLVEPDFDD